MAAWKHHRYWTAHLYSLYRKYVYVRAESLEGSTLDCADLSVSLLMEFASFKGLCVTFTDNDGTRYISKATGQCPSGLKHWGDRQEKYVQAVLDRIGAESLFLHNMDINPRGPEVGDMMLKADHAAMVYRVYLPGMVHPLAERFVGNATPRETAPIPQFPGDLPARAQLHQTRYFRELSPAVGPMPPSSPHIDYLNHRGFGKERAELILFADAGEMVKMGFDFYQYDDSVLDDWSDWDGNGNPPR